MAEAVGVVLALAANTSFGGLPVLASLLARHHYRPHLFGLRDDRQVFASGIWALAALSGALLVAVAGNARIHRCYQRAGELPGPGSIPGKPEVKPTVVVVPVAGVSRLAQRAISGALSISKQLIAVTVVTDDPGLSTGRDRELQEQWARWNPGPPLQVLHIEYASITAPILAFIGQLREQRTEQIVVLIAVAAPDRLPYLSCTLTLTWCSLELCAAAPTSSLRASRCHCFSPLASMAPGIPPSASGYEGTVTFVCVMLRPRRWPRWATAIARG